MDRRYGRVAYGERRGRRGTVAGTRRTAKSSPRGAEISEKAKAIYFHFVTVFL